MPNLSKLIILLLIIFNGVNSSFAFEKKEKLSIKLKSKNSAMILIHFKEEPDEQIIKSKIKKIKEQYHINPFPLFKQDLTKILRKINFFETYEKKNYFDPRRIYKFYWPQSSNPKAIIEKLEKEKLIDRVYIYPQGKLSSIETAPDLTPSQNYLSTLEIDLVHEQSNYGQNSTIIDFEYHWNENHLDLNLNNNSFINRPLCHQNDLNPPHCSLWTAHGTAIAGLIKGQNNQHGILGVSPETNLKLYSLRNHNLAEALMDVLYHVEEGLLQAGATLLIQSQYQGAQANFLFDDSRGNLPAEVIPIHFELFELLSGFGLSLVQAAGNGSVNLNEAHNYLPFHMNLAENRSEALIVASSNSQMNQKADFSNCGDRIDFFTPGLQLTTTSYPFDESPYQWENPDFIDFLNNEINNHYINNFSGTSASSAILAGITNLIQGHTKSRLGDKKNLLSFKIKEILSSEIALQNNACPVGKKIELESSLRELDQFLDEILENFPELNETKALSEDRYFDLRLLGIDLLCIEHNNAASDPLCPEVLVWPSGIGIGKKLDFDGDGRSDLFETSMDNAYTIIDLSSEGQSFDRFGDWDASLGDKIGQDYSEIFLADLNNDQRSDFIHLETNPSRKLSILYTTRDLLENGLGYNYWHLGRSAINWDEEIFYEEISPTYSPLYIGDFDGNGWLDISIVVNNRIWRIDLNGPQGLDGQWDIEKRLLAENDLRFPEIQFFSGHFTDSHCDNIAVIKASENNPNQKELIIFELENQDQSCEENQLTYRNLPQDFLYVSTTGQFDSRDELDDILIRSSYAFIEEGRLFYLPSDREFSEKRFKLQASSDALLKGIGDYDGDHIEDIFFSEIISSYVYYSRNSYNFLEDNRGFRYLNYNDLGISESFLLFQYYY